MGPMTPGPPPPPPPPPAGPPPPPWPAVGPGGSGRPEPVSVCPNFFFNRSIAEVTELVSGSLTFFSIRPIARSIIFWESLVASLRDFFSFILGVRDTSGFGASGTGLGGATETAGFSGGGLGASTGLGVSDGGAPSPAGGPGAGPGPGKDTRFTLMAPGGS